MSNSLTDRVKWFSAVRKLRPLMVGIISAVQTHPGEIQIMSIALAFYVLCKGGKVDPIMVMKMIERMESHIDGPYANQFKAMIEYARNELNE